MVVDVEVWEGVTKNSFCSASLVPTFSFGENFTFTPGRPNGEGTDLRKVQDKILDWTPPGRFPLIPLLK